MALAPSTIAAVLAVLASRHEPALTLAVRQAPCTGRPVPGSIRWCTASAPSPERRTVTLEVARPPVSIATVCPGASSAAVVVGDADLPTAFGRATGDGDVAAETDERTAPSGGHGRCRRHVRRECLGGRTKIELNSGGKRDAAGRFVDPHRCIARGGLDPDLPLIQRRD